MNLLERLQHASDDAKRIYLIAGTMISIAIIVAVWIAWFNDPIDLAAQDVDAGTANAGERIGGFSFWESMRATLGDIGGAIMSPREYEVKPTD